MRLILVGFGTVAQSLVQIINSDRDRLVNDYGFDPTITTIVDSRGFCQNENGLDLNRVLKTKDKHGTVGRYSSKTLHNVDSSRNISNNDAEVLVETTPSNFKDAEPGLSNIKKALSSGKHVVTANKGPLALAMPALLELASHKKRRLLFSGTVGGGTPYLSFASKSLPGEKITSIRGVLNGTSNYILSRMMDPGLSFKEALREAKAKGYSEADPSNDTEGYDTAAKIVIIANWIMKRRIHLQDVQITGIAKVTREILNKAKTAASEIKLIGHLAESQATVKPEAVSSRDPLCVPDTLNALTFGTEHAGEMTLIGRGAGGKETASAIIRDLVEIRNEFAL